MNENKKITKGTKDIIERDMDRLSIDELTNLCVEYFGDIVERKHIKIKNFIAAGEEFVIVMPKAQRKPEYTQDIVKTVIHKSSGYARTNQERKIDEKEKKYFEESKTVEGDTGNSKIIIVNVDGVWYLVDGGHRLFSLNEFIRKNRVCSMYYPDDPNVEGYLKMLRNILVDAGVINSKSKSFKFNQLPKAVQEALLEYELEVQYIITDSADHLGRYFIEANKRRAISSNNRINAKEYNVTIFDELKNLAEKIAKYDETKGIETIMPECMKSKNVIDKERKNFETACIALRRTGKDSDSIQKLLIRCLDGAWWTLNNNEKSQVEICERHRGQSDESTSYLMVELFNALCTCARTIDPCLLEDINIWTGFVHTFGIPHSKLSHSYKYKKKDENNKDITVELDNAEKPKQIVISDRFIKNKAREFSKILLACKKSDNYLLTKTGMVINKKYIDNNGKKCVKNRFDEKILTTSSQSFTNLVTISNIMEAVYREVR